MLGLMQDWPLRVSSIIDHAAKYHAGRAIVSRSVEDHRHREGHRQHQRGADRLELPDRHVVGDEGGETVSEREQALGRDDQNRRCGSRSDGQLVLPQIHDGYSR